MTATTTEERRSSWESFLAPRALLLGIACSFLACCLAGALVGRHNPFHNFERFHPCISPNSNFYPTASQVRALAEDRLPRDKIAVIVGGNSIAHGVGQRSGHVWTNRLQEELGDDYRVINLAMHGAGPGAFAAVAAEMLSADHPKLIYVAGIGSNGVPNEPDGPNPYRYFFWDAYDRGLLRDAPERESAVRRVCQERNNDAAFKEMRWQMQLDRFANSRDLWTTLAYRSFSTFWSPFTRQCFWKPRKVYADEQAGGLLPFEQRYPAWRDADEMRIVGGWARFGSTYYAGAQPPAVEALRTNFPEPYRRRTLLLLVRDSPYYVERLSPAERKSYRGAYSLAASVLEREGFAALEAGRDYNADDFFDRCHLSEAGGARMAGQVSVKIRRMAHDLGFVREDRP